MSLTSVVHVEGVVVEAVKDSRGFPAQILKAAGNVLIHREPPDLLDRLVLPQQVGLHRHRHAAAITGCTPNQTPGWKHSLLHTPDRTLKMLWWLLSVNQTPAWKQSLYPKQSQKVCDAALNLSAPFMFTSATHVTVNMRSKYWHGLWLVRSESPAQSANKRPRNDSAISI